MILFDFRTTRTPDGWTKVTSTVQYDEPTRRLWEELQKPYGNQSSFLRHLLLLEKYFRNGDLLLSQNANPNAIVYAESVQHRLQAYDNIPPRPISVTQLAPPNSVTTANKAITISKVNTPAPSKSVTVKSNPSVTVTSKPNSSESTNSLLKSNVTQPPRSRNYTVTTEPINGDRSTVVSSKTDLIKLNNATVQQGNTSTPKNKSIGLPPELICINSSSSNEKTNEKQPSVPLSYQLQMQLTLAQQIQQQHQNSLLLPQQTKQMIQNMATPSSQHANKSNQIISPKKQSTNTSTGNAATNTNKSPPNKGNNNIASNKSNVIRLPDSLTEAEQLKSKDWRPTLMPLSAENNKNNTDIYLTADGRKLPYLVQVQSGGKPYMISIFDYNRMCILRRERLLSDRPELMKGKSNPNQNQSNAPKQPVTAHTASNNQKTSNVIDVEKLNKSQTQKTNNGPIPKVQIPNKVLEQNSLIPITNKPNENLSASDSLLKRNKANQSSLLKSNALHQSHKSQQVQPKLPLSMTNSSQSNVVSITSTPSISAILAMNNSTTASIPPPIQLIPNSQPITITNVTTGSSSSTSQANVSALEALFKTTNQVTTNPSVMLQWAEQLNKCSNLSNNSFGSTNNDSATSILSKIPKSLTVIPQAKRPSKD